MRRIALLLALPIAACNTIAVTSQPFKPSADELARSRAIIANGMKDPASAQFREGRSFFLDNGDVVYCGEVNAKNSYGGYTGFTPYWLRMRGTMIEAKLFDEPASIGCGEVAMGRTTVSS